MSLENRAFFDLSHGSKPDFDSGFGRISLHTVRTQSGYVGLRFRPIFRVFEGALAVRPKPVQTANLRKVLLNPRQVFVFDFLHFKTPRPIARDKSVININVKQLK